MSSNEELAISARSGSIQATHELWENVRRYAVKIAKRWDHAFEGYAGVTMDDLTDSAYIALCDAAASYDPDKGCFLTLYALHLKTAFSECYGVRGSRRDPLNKAKSLDAPLDDGDSDSALTDVIADPEGESPLRDLEDRLYCQRLRAALDATLDELPDACSAVLRKRYYEDLTYEEIAAAEGVSRQAVQAAERKSLRAIRFSPGADRLMEFYDFDYYRGVGLQRFRETGETVQERYLLNQERAQKRRRGSRARLSPRDLEPWYELE